MKVIDPLSLTKNILAVDIGKKGGMCGNEYLQPYLKLRRTPEDLKEFVELIKWYDPELVIAENVHIYGPQMGGEVLVEQRGILKGVCATLDVELIFVDPKKWMNCYTIKGKKNFKSYAKWKQHLMDIASNLDSPIADYGEKLDAWTSDAMLIWNYQAAIEIDEPLPHRGQFTLRL